MPTLSLSDVMHLGSVVLFSCENFGVRVVPEVLQTWIVDHGRLARGGKRQQVGQPPPFESRVEESRPTGQIWALRLPRSLNPQPKIVAEKPRYSQWCIATTNAPQERRIRADVPVSVDGAHVERNLISTFVRPTACDRAKQIATRPPAGWHVNF